MNPEEKKIYMKAYYKANKEKLNKQSKDWNKANRVNAKIWYQDNKVKLKADRESMNLNYYIVYCLPNFNNDNKAYAGITNQPSVRMRSHKSLGKNIEGWFILGVLENKIKARQLEIEYHNKGYSGAYIKKTIKK